MSLAPAAYLLFNRVMRHDPTDPTWPGRDRFVLSCGHSSLTLYIQLYLSGYGLTIDDLAALRQWGSLTAGHPEHGTPPASSDHRPARAGHRNAVGMAMAARRERGLFRPGHRPGESPFDHLIYGDCSDGDIEEGVEPRVSGIAAVQKLGNSPDLRRQRDLHRGRHPHRKAEDVRARYAGVRLARAARGLAHGDPSKGDYHEDVEGALPAILAAEAGDRASRRSSC
jgi:transketolase